MFPMPPSKSMMDYLNEMNRLFPRTSENDLSHTFNPNMSPFSQSAMANRSSSSADSTSPELYASGPFPSNSGMYQTDRVHDSPMSLFERSDTPLGIRRQRPIVGRKILSNPENLAVSYESSMRVSPAKPPEPDFDMTNIWQQDDPMMPQHTPPNVNNIFIENKNYTQNVFYELFPSDKRGFEFKTPVKTLSPTATTSSNVSPTMSLSPNNLMRSPVVPRYPPGFSTPPPYNLNKSPSFGSRQGPPVRYQDISNQQDIRPQRLCTFCRKNGETPIVYMAHSVRERIGNRQIVTCPILRSHVCLTCGASGDDAHTITYCPVIRRSNNGLPIPSTTITLKNTRVKSNGRRRF